MQGGAEQLKDWMRRRGFTQADAARYFGVGQDYISVLVSAKRSPGLENAIKIERLTGIPVEAWASTELDELDPSTSPVSAKRQS